MRSAPAYEIMVAMSAAYPSETALLLICPEAEPVVSHLRSRHDAAAQDGVPAHVTVLFPFKPLDALAADDHHRLESIFGAVEPFVLSGSRTGWFANRVLYVAPDDPDPVLALVSQVTAAYPDYLPYGGVFDEVIPHLTIGHDHPIEELRAAEHEVRRSLPFSQPLDHVELWTGPAVHGREEPAVWRYVRSYEFGRASGVDHVDAG